MEDKPLDLSKKSVTSNRESQFPSSDKEQETEKEKNQRTSKSRSFPQEEIPKIRRANEQSVTFHHRNRANETNVPQDMFPGNGERTKRKITAGPGINSGVNRHQYVESPPNPNAKDKQRVLDDHDYSDKATRDCTCHEPSTSAGPNCSLHFSGIEGLSTCSNHGEKSFACVHRDRICSSPADLKHSGMYTLERPTGRNVKDTPRMSDVSDISERGTSEISPTPSANATENSSYDADEVQVHSPIIHIRTPTSEIHVRSNTGEKPFECQLCDKRYYSKGALARHNRRHTGEGLLKCDYCNNSFVSKGNLDRHKRLHTGERPFVCQVCNKGFAGKSNLNQHMRTHTKEKPYKCRICHKIFALNSNLNKHLNIHSKEKPYKCTICDKSFSQKPHLNRHLRIHSKEKPP